jgi:hypothetical protein
MLFNVLSGMSSRMSSDILQRLRARRDLEDEKPCSMEMDWFLFQNSD